MGNYFSNPSTPLLLTVPLPFMVARLVPGKSKARALNTAAKSLQMALPFSADLSDISITFGISEKSGDNPETALNNPAKKPGASASLRSGLRVVRVFDSGVSPSCAGRMVISGRLSDVCAELERMSQAQIRPK